jgi:hypothetical protein
MPLRQTIFIVLAVLAFLLAFIYFDMVTSVVPGWHTTIYAGASWHQYLFPVVLFGIAVLYRRIAKRGIFVSRAFFITHLLFTVIVYIVANFGAALYFRFLLFTRFDNYYLERLLFMAMVTDWSQWFLIAGEIVFGVLLWLKLTSRPQIPQSGI